VNGISSFQQSLREINDIIDTVRDQLIIEVQRYEEENKKKKRIELLNLIL
jgi:hypothetical protein